MLGLVLAVIMELVMWMLNWSTNILGLKVITIGFKVSLSFVNLLFVFGLLVIALQLILDYKANDAQKSLGKVVVAAVLVNFSFLIAGVILDVGNILTSLFMDNININQFGEMFGLNSLARISDSLGNGGGDYPVFASIIVGCFMIFFHVSLIITMGTLFVMVLIRNLRVIGLVIFMPLIWGLYAVPFASAQKYVEQWWEDMFKWGILYLPIVTFFIWIAVQSVAGIGLIDESPAAIDPNKGFLNAFVSDYFGLVLQLIVSIGIIAIGMKEAESRGADFAGKGVSAFKSVNKGMLSKSKKIGKGAARRTFVDNRVAQKAIRPVRTFADNKLGQIEGLKDSGSKASRIAGTLLSPFGRATARFMNRTQQNEEGIKKKQKELFDKTNDSQVLGYRAGSDEAKAAQLRELIDRGLIQKFISTRTNGLADITELAAATGRKSDKEIGKLSEIKELLSKRPELVPQILTDVGGVGPGNPNQMIINYVGKMSPSDVAKMDSSSLNNEAVVRGILSSKNATRSAINDSNREFREKFVDIVKTGNVGAGIVGLSSANQTDYQRITSDLTNTNKELTDAIARGDAGEVSRQQANRDFSDSELRAFSATLSPEEKSILAGRYYAQQVIVGLPTT